MCIEHAAWHVNLGIILTQQGILKDLDNLFDTSGTNLKLGAKFRDEFDYFAFIFFPIKMSCDILENIALLLMTGRILFNISN